ncbi:MAG: helix-turn-helix domain-containing protein [Atopobiaceae bacterium]|jgi:hypothetical protein|nr:helix-turn-helix domain-containing protein [Atopobiaceae bacterium]
MSKIPESSRGWHSLAGAGVYTNLSPEDIRRAINSGELAAYEKPLTYGRKPGARKHVFVRIKSADLDMWLESQPRVVYGGNGVKEVETA